MYCLSTKSTGSTAPWRKVLYSAMEDYALDIIIGKGPSARSIRLDLARFTLIGATTRAGSLSAPLRDRFGVISKFELYTVEELTEIIRRTARILGVTADEDSLVEMAALSRNSACGKPHAETNQGLFTGERKWYNRYGNYTRGT